jgi:hypothetical protein
LGKRDSRELRMQTREAPSAKGADGTMMMWACGAFPCAQDTLGFAGAP